MKNLPFTKMHGTGNDFVVLDGIRRAVRVTPALAQALCDRRFGVGADQVLVLEKPKKAAPSRSSGTARGAGGAETRADFRMLIYNADGSQVEMCGNGIRCLALFARERGHTKKSDMTVETRGGIKRPVIGKGLVRVDMGEPILDAALIPTKAKGRVVEKVFAVKGAPPLKVTAVSMGNPHAVIFVKDVDAVPLEAWGRVLENHPFFPKRANVEFVQVLSPDRAKVRVWERGSGATLACGTGACAVGVAGVLTGRLRRRVTLALPGGDLAVEWAADNHVFMTGPAAFVYDGNFNL